MNIAIKKCDFCEKDFRNDEARNFVDFSIVESPTGNRLDMCPDCFQAARKVA